MQCNGSVYFYYCSSSVQLIHETFNTIYSKYNICRKNNRGLTSRKSNVSLFLRQLLSRGAYLKLLLYPRISVRLRCYKNFKVIMLRFKKNLIISCTLGKYITLFWNNVTMIVHFFCAHMCTRIN